MRLDIEKTKEIMKKKNLTGVELADKLGLNYKYTNRILNAYGRQANPKYETVETIATALDVDVNTIVKGG